MDEELKKRYHKVLQDLYEIKNNVITFYNHFDGILTTLDDSILIDNKRADINRLDKIGQSLENLKIHLNENIIPIVLKRVSSK